MAQTPGQIHGVLVMYTIPDTGVEKLLPGTPQTAAGLRPLNIQVFHPSTSKRYTPLEREVPTRVSTATRTALEQINTDFRYCRLFATPPSRFRASMPPEGFLFNHEVADDLVRLERFPVLHVVCMDMNFQGAVGLRSTSAEEI